MRIVRSLRFTMLGRSIRNNLCLFLLLLPLCFGIHANAQDQKKPGNFFPKDYINKPGKQAAPSRKQPKDFSKPKRPAQLKKGKDAKGKNILDLFALDGEVVVDKKETGALPAKSAFSSGIPLKSIGVILNSSDNMHFLSNLKNLIQTAIKYDLSISRVYAIGKLPRLDADEEQFSYTKDMFTLWLLDGLLLPSDKIPKEYNVTRSPTWILNTSEGEILLEGMLTLEKHLNSKGEFVDKNFVAVPVVEPSSEENDEKKS
ncbi:hypothetical protein OAO01_03455 [Oligoflexia bacterium]|nr:hypothetical protein [Oligoflexia bacterium]